MDLDDALVKARERIRSEREGKTKAKEEAAAAAEKQKQVGCPATKAPHEKSGSSSREVGSGIAHTLRLTES